MADWRARLNDILQDLEQERDELRVKMHLGMAEAKDAWDEIDAKIDGIRARLASEAEDKVDDAEEAWEVVRDEVKSAFARIRERLSKEPPKAEG